MSNEKGKPVHLTNGERRLLIALLEGAIAGLTIPESPPGGLKGPAKDAAQVARMRLRQYRRLIHEMNCPWDTEDQFVAPGSYGPASTGEADHG